MGSRLSTQKNKVPYGQWEQWIEDNLEFDVRTVRRYIQVWEARKLVESQSKDISITQVYKLLASPPPPDQPAKNTLDRSAGESEVTPKTPANSTFQVQPTIDSKYYTSGFGAKATSSEDPEPEEKPRVTQGPKESGKPLFALAIWDELEGLYGKALNRLDELNKVCRNPLAHAKLIGETKALMGQLSVWRESVRKA
jgi:Protein of unknown function (DUF3102)